MRSHEVALLAPGALIGLKDCSMTYVGIVTSVSRFEVCVTWFHCGQLWGHREYDVGTSNSSHTFSAWTSVVCP